MSKNENTKSNVSLTHVPPFRWCLCRAPVRFLMESSTAADCCALHGGFSPHSAATCWVKSDTAAALFLWQYEKWIANNWNSQNKHRTGWWPSGDNSFCFCSVTAWDTVVCLLKHIFPVRHMLMVYLESSQQLVAVWAAVLRRRFILSCRGKPDCKRNTCIISTLLSDLQVSF